MHTLKAKEALNLYLTIVVSPKLLVVCPYKRRRTN
jgi:hypothetical protein